MTKECSPLDKATKVLEQHGLKVLVREERLEWYSEYDGPCDHNPTQFPGKVRYFLEVIE